MKKTNKSVQVKKIGLVIKHHQPQAAVLATEIVEYLVSRKCQIYFADESKSLANAFTPHQSGDTEKGTITP